MKDRPGPTTGMTAKMTALLRPALFLWLLAVPATAAPDLNLEEIERLLTDLPPEQRAQTIDELRGVLDRLAHSRPSTEEPKQQAPSWFNRVKLRHSAYNKAGIPKPASFQYTSPRSDDDSYAIDLGVTLLPWTEKDYVLGPKFEFHRNTLLDKEQDVLRSGLAGGHSWGRPAANAHDDPSSSWWAWLDSSADLKHDRVEDTRSYQVSATLMPLHSDLALGAARDLFRIGLPVLFDLEFGLEYEDIYDSTKVQRGSVSRGTIVAGALFYPWAARLNNRLQFAISAQHWTELGQSGHFDDSSTRFRNLGLSLNYYLTEKQNIAISLSHVNGENPSSGLPDQVFTRVGLLVKSGD